MKIAQIVSLYESVPPKSQNGLEFVVSWLTEGLVKKGHEVTLFASADSRTSAKLASIIPISVLNDKQSRWEKPYPIYWNAAYAASHAQEFDVIHDHSGAFKLFTPYISPPIIETIHAAYNDEFRQYNLTDNTYREKMQFVLDQYSQSHFVTVSKNQEKAFSACEPYYFKKHSTIYNGIPVNEFIFNQNPQEYLLFIGYINKNKGADIAVQVAKALDMKLILAGNNFGEETFFKEHIEPYLNDKIQYVGPVNFEQKNKLYRNAIAKLAPLYWHEPFGLTLVESQACGTPVIAFNKGAAPELIQHGITGYIVENMEEMITSVREIGLIDRKKCRTWVENNFSTEKMVDEYEALYKKIVTEK